MSTDSQPDSLDIPAALLAVVFPGAGQMFRGKLYRGVMACLGVLGLFLGGIFIGGIDVVDSKEDRIWFFGQAIVGPVTFGVDALHQKRFKAYSPLPRPDPAKDLKGKLRSGYPTETRVWSDSNDRFEWVEDPSGKGPPNTKSISKMNELGTLYATLAGMLNFIIILDALMPGKRGRTELDKVTASGLFTGEVVATTVASEMSV